MMEQLQEYPRTGEALPRKEYVYGKYILKFATTPEELDQVLRLRFEVFNLELGEGLDESLETGRDMDAFDVLCHHLMIIDRDTGIVAGTYRMQTNLMAIAHKGFYSAGEYDLRSLPEDVLKQSMEVGRACIHKDHRNGRVLFLLWRGLAKYAEHNQCRYMFGCCSIASQDPEEGLMVLDWLQRNGHMHPTIVVHAQKGYECHLAEDVIRVFPNVEIPQLMKIYLNYKAKICSLPAVDASFKTIDFLTLIDLSDLDARTRQNLFKG